MWMWMWRWQWHPRPASECAHPRPPSPPPTPFSLYLSTRHTYTRGQRLAKGARGVYREEVCHVMQWGCCADRVCRSCVSASLAPLCTLCPLCRFAPCRSPFNLHADGHRAACAELAHGGRLAPRPGRAAAAAAAPPPGGYSVAVVERNVGPAVRIQVNMIHP